MDGSRVTTRAEAVLDIAEWALPEPGGLAALAVITAIEGPAYRPLGAALSLGADGRILGQVSAGCIDGDVALHLREVAQDGRARHLRYGQGSPFVDLPLPCGGAIEVAVMPAPPIPVQVAIARARQARQPLDLYLAPALGGLALHPDSDAALRLTLRPDPRFAVFGSGPEAEAFTRLARASGYDVELACPDPAVFPDLAPRRLSRTDPLGGITVDPRTAGVLFFHDHGREIPILRALLDTEIGFIGAQGSQRAAAARAASLRAEGVSEAQIARIRGPVGLIARARDPRLLAVSVLAEALQAAQA